MFTVTAVHVGATAATAASWQPGFFLMVLVLAAGAVGSVVVAVQNRHRRQ